MDLLVIMEAFKEEFKKVEAELSKPEVAADPDKLTNLSKKHSNLSEIISIYNDIQQKKAELIEWHSLRENSNSEELGEIEKAVIDLEQELIKEELHLKFLLVPDTLDDKNIIVEIRAGTGGNEAALFAGDLFRMYTRYAERNNWKVELVDENATDLGGYKEVVFSIKGKGVYSKMKYESGVHRVQRVPSTESGGRIHTSTATVAVLSEVSEVDYKIDPVELRIDTYRSGGAGGQHVNKTDSAVRIVHIPTGITVAVQKERSQHQNKARAMEILRAKLYEMYNAEQQNEVTEKRRSQIGTGERSEKIRTYNYPQNRITDHRINFTSYKLMYAMDGDLDEVTMKLAEANISLRLEKLHKELAGE